MITKQELINIVLEILTKDQMNELVSKLKAIEERLSVEDPAPEQKQVQKKLVNDDFTVNRQEGQRKSVPVRASENTWTDTGEERLEEVQIVKPLTPRNRKKAKMITVTCSVCHQSKEISTALVTSSKAYYRCENCVGGGR